MDIDTLKRGDILFNSSTSDKNRMYMIYSHKYTPYVHGYESNGSQLRKVRYNISQIESEQDGESVYRKVGHTNGFDVLLGDLERIIGKGHSKQSEFTDAYLEGIESSFIQAEPLNLVDASLSRIDYPSHNGYPTGGSGYTVSHGSFDTRLDEDESEDFANHRLDIAYDLLCGVDQFDVVSVSVIDQCVDDENIVTIGIVYK